MGKHINKEGKRKCYGCHQVFPLTLDYFSACNRKYTLGFRYNCKKCSNYKYDLRKILIKGCGFKCNNCNLYKPDDYSFFDIDHITPLKRRTNGLNVGTYLRKKDGEKNLQVLCPNCHRIKTIKDRKNNLC